MSTPSCHVLRTGSCDPGPECRVLYRQYPRIMTCVTSERARQSRRKGVARPLHPSLRLTDPTAYARRTVAAHDAVFSATTVPCASAARRAPGLHPQMLAAWRRSGEAGVRPDQEMPRRVLTDDDLRLARERTPLSRVAGEVVRAVADTSAAGRHLVVLTDADGVVLWRAGSAQAMRGADRIDFAEGADWSEAGLGTNGMSRALETGGMPKVTVWAHISRV